MSSSTEEATINPDGTFAGTGADAGAGGPEASGDSADSADFNDVPPGAEEANVVKGTDPALYLAFGFIVVVVLYVLHYKRSKRKQEEMESWFLDMDGEKFNIKLPSAVDEYYDVREAAEKGGWVPGEPAADAAAAASGPQRALAQALMKRCIADIPLVTFIQKESPGMNKLYSQSMCSVKQWKTYQAAEQMVSAEVEEVRAEADDIEPGWSQAIWRQGMQYHNMLKNKHEQEMKQREALAAKKALEEEEAKKPKLTPEEIAKQKEIAAENAAKELLEAEEREKSAKKNFGNGMKKGFLDAKKKSK